METVARLAVVALLVVPLVVLVVRTPRRRLGVRTDAAHDEATRPAGSAAPDPDARRLASELGALAAHGGATGQGVGVGVGVEPPNRFSAEIASWTA